MATEITLVERDQQHTLSIHRNVGTMKMAKVMGPAYTAIMEHLKKQNVACGDKDIPFTRYNHIDWPGMEKQGLLVKLHMLFFKKWDMHIGIPCPTAATPDGSIETMTVPAGKYLRALHTGPYMNVGNTYTAMQKYGKEHQLAFDDWSIEYYLNDPRETAQNELQTEVFVPLAT